MAIAGDQLEVSADDLELTGNRVQVKGTPERSITVHFRDKEKVQDFADLIGVPVSDKAKSIYFPYEERQDLTGVHYVGGGDV